MVPYSRRSVKGVNHAFVIRSMTRYDRPMSSILQRPQGFLLASVFAMSFMFATWQVLLNNFVIERAQFTGAEIGILQSLREIPGFLAFTAIFILLIVKEQTVVLVSIAVMGLGVALTGFFPSAIGLYCTTVLMSIGFHYFETLNKSLTLQWLDKQETAHFLGRALSIKAVGSLGAYGLIYIAMSFFAVDYLWIYLIVGGVGILLALLLWIASPLHPQKVSQTKKIVLKKEYWLFYALTFMSGARRQIFVVFAGFMMVEKFGYSVANISALFIFNYTFNFFFAAKLGKWIGKIGDRRALTIEYIGLIGVFISYAFTTNANVAAALYIIDHLFFAFAIAISTYFQKIAKQEDIASTASVSFTINHIAAVAIPALLGILWLSSPTAVFLLGAGFAFISLILALNIPDDPGPGKEVRLGYVSYGTAVSTR